MHTGSLPESSGSFSAERLCSRPCRTCDQVTEHKCETWNSSCGGFTDYKFTCLICRAVHWIDGIDS